MKTVPLINKIVAGLANPLFVSADAALSLIVPRTTSRAAAPYALVGFTLFAAGILVQCLVACFPPADLNDSFRLGAAGLVASGVGVFTWVNAVCPFAPWNIGSLIRFGQRGN